MCVLRWSLKSPGAPAGGCGHSAGLGLGGR